MMKKSLITRLLRIRGNTSATAHQGAVEVPLAEREGLDAGSLLDLADSLQRAMAPVQPRTPFIYELRKKLVYRARRRQTAARRTKHTFKIGAAVVGALVSAASIVGAIILVVKTLHERTQARAALQAPQA